MKSHQPQVNLLCSLALLIICASAMATLAQSQSEQNGVDDSGKGTIKGRVVNEKGQPLPNAMVIADGYGTDVAEKYAITDNEGNFQLNGLASVAYSIHATLPAYIQAPRDPDPDPIGYYRTGDSVTLEMIKGGVITGMVKRTSGEAVVWVVVHAFKIRDSRGQPGHYAIATPAVMTDDRGVYRLYGLEPGTYVVWAGGTTGNGYMVDAYGGDVPVYAPASPRETAAEISVSSGEEASNVDIRYRDEPGHTVSGTTVGAGEQPRPFQITLSSIVNGRSEESSLFYQPQGTRGFFFSAVPDGDYELVASSYAAEDALVSDARRLKVRGADISGIELMVKPLGSISGSIVLQELKVAECAGKRRPVFGETVVSALHNEKKVSTDLSQSVWELGTPVVPNQQGNFVLQNLAGGEYRFNVRPAAKYWYLKSIAWPPTSKELQVNRPLDAARNWTTLKTGDRLSGLIITFAAGAASLEGKIDTTEGQKRPARLFVYLVPAERDKAEDVLRYSASLAAEDGSFSLSNVPPGRYWVITGTPREGETNLLVKLRLPDENENRARLLREGEDAKIQVELKPCQNVSDYRLPFRRANQ